MACSCERFLGRDCPDCNHEPSASFTDEDVERVVEALWRKEFDQTPEEMREQSRREHESDGWVDDYVKACEDTARTALSAYLEPTTKEDA